MNNNYAIIMAGGIGSRFWPLSTPERPKQFLDILGIGKTLIQMTYERLLPLVNPENIFILTNTSYAAIVKEQLPALTDNQILTEPQRKNTAPCIAYAAAKIVALNPEANLIVCPSDHLILREDKFRAIIEIGLADAALTNSIITIGINPTKAHTGYGYIEIDAKTSREPGSVSNVMQFREKPDLTTAEKFIAAGNFFWNSGIFIWKASTVIGALKNHQADIYALFCQETSAYNTPNEQAFVNNAFELTKDISIDYAVLEKATNVKVVISDFDWSDLGTWGSLAEHIEKDAQNNSIIGSNIHIFDASNNLINSKSGKKVLINGIHDCIVVESEDVLMILSQKDEQELKHFVAQIEQK